MSTGHPSGTSGSVAGVGAGAGGHEDLKKIYILQIRTKLEQSAVVWHSSLTKKNVSDLERVQKAAIRVILKDKYQNYGDALSALKIKSLKDR